MAEKKYVPLKIDRKGLEKDYEEYKEQTSLDDFLDGD